jgi:hypothetical protein
MGIRVKDSMRGREGGLVLPCLPSPTAATKAALSGSGTGSGSGRHSTPAASPGTRVEPSESIRVMQRDWAWGQQPAWAWGRKISPALLHALVAGVLQLASEVGSEKSDRQDTTDGSPILSLEQMVSRLHHLAATVAPHDKLGAQPRQPPSLSEDEQAAERTEPEPDLNRHFGETTES